MKKPVRGELVQLRFGAPEEKGPDAEPLLELLLACHADIRRFARLALTIGARPELPADEVRSGAEACLCFFTEVLPLHVSDEEDSLWPRLAGRSAALDATMAQMRAQHFGHVVRLAALAEALQLAQSRPNDACAHRLLASAASTLETDFDDHLRLEESELFPSLALLPVELRELIIEESRARRQVSH